MKIHQIIECTSGMKIAYVNGDNIVIAPVTVWAIVDLDREGGNRSQVVVGMGGAEHIYNPELADNFVCYIPGEYSQEEALAFASRWVNMRRDNGELRNV